MKSSLAPAHHVSKRRASPEPSNLPLEQPQEQPGPPPLRRSNRANQKRDFYAPSPGKLLSEATAHRKDRVASGAIAAELEAREAKRAFTFPTSPEPLQPAMCSTCATSLPSSSSSSSCRPSLTA
jgi:hypothetical protein